MKQLKVTSTSFKQGEPIPSKYTCEGLDISPPLHIDDVPATAKTLVIIVDDPDAPVGTFDHWLAWNIPAATKALPEAVSVAVQGINHFGEFRYRGPCPPKGKPHRYYFRVFALNIEINLSEGSHRRELEEAIKNNIIASGELMGTYQR